MKLDRPLNPMQLAFHYLGKLVNPNSGELLTLAGPLDVSILRQAIQSAVSRHPLINSTPITKYGKPYWRESQHPLPIDLQIRSTRKRKESSVVTELLTNLWNETLPADGRQVKFIYTKGPQRSYLQICAPHTVTDAWSGTRLAADIASAYSAIAKGERWSAKASRPIERKIKDVFLSRLSTSQKLGVAYDTSRHLVRDILEPGAGLELGKGNRSAPTALSITRVPKALLGNTLTQARRHGVTAHALFLLALTRARTEMVSQSDPQLFRINDFASLRPFADRDVREVFDVLVVPNQLTIDPNWDDQTALKILSGRLKYQKQRGVFSELYRLSLYGKLGRLLPTRLTAQIVFKFINKTDIAVTNPGRVPWQDELERFGDVPVLDFINFPHLLPPSKAVLIFTTFRDELRIVQLYDPSLLPDGLGQTLVEPLVKHLERLVQALAHTETSI